MRRRRCLRKIYFRLNGGLRGGQCEEYNIIIIIVIVVALVTVIHSFGDKELIKCNVPQFPFVFVDYLRPRLLVASNAKVTKWVHYYSIFGHLQQ